MEARTALTTGVDQLIELVNAKKRIALTEAASQLHVPVQNVEDWAAILEQSGIISLEYSLTKTYLVKKEMNRQELAEKAAELKIEKRAFEGKNAVMFAYLDRLEKQIESLQELIKQVSVRKIVRSELKKVKQLGTEKDSVDRELVDVRRGVLLQLQKLNQQIKFQENKTKVLYDDMLEQLINASSILNLENEELGLIKKNEKKLESQLSKVTKLLDRRLMGIRKKKDRIGKKSRSDVRALNRKSASMRRELSNMQKQFKRLMAGSEKRGKSLKKLHVQIVGKIRKHEGKLYGKTPRQVKQFLEKRMEHSDLLGKIYHEEQMLKDKLLAFLGKGKTLNPGSAKFEDEVIRLNEDLAALNQRRKSLEKDVRELVSKLK